jgi:hypothetical protein
MTNVIILYRLKPGVDPNDFEQWLRDTDFPALRQLKNIATFVTFKVLRRAMDPREPSLQYVEIFDVPNLAKFLEEDLASSAAQAMMGEFRTFVQDPEYLIAEPVV